MPTFPGDLASDCEKLTPELFILNVSVVTGSWLGCCLTGDVSGVFRSSILELEPSPELVGGGNEKEYFLGAGREGCWWFWF